MESKAVYHTTIYAFLIRSKDGARMLCFVRRSLPIGEKKNIGSRQNIKISKSARFEMVRDLQNMHGFGTLLLCGISLPSVHFASM